jgi:hypothetical protein
MPCGSRAGRTVESSSRDTLGVITVPLRERPHIGVVSLKKTVCRRALNPVQKLRVIGAVDFARWCCACDHVVHAPNAGYHGLGYLQVGKAHLYFLALIA